MYTLMECFVIAGVTFVLGAVLFLSIALVVLLMAAVRVVVTRAHPLASHAQSELREELVASPLAQPVSQGN